MVAAVNAAELAFSDRLIEILSRVECRRADGEDDREAIYRLRYSSYRAQNAIAADRSRRFFDRFDGMENEWTFGLYVDGELASSIRIHVASPEHPQSPALEVFADHLEPDIAAGRTIIDPTRFVTEKSVVKRLPELPYATVRLGFAAVQHFSADIALATVRREHQAFYRRLFGFRPVAMPRPYPTLKQPIILMENRDRSKLVELPNRFPFLASTPAERQALFEHVAAAEPLRFRRDVEDGRNEGVAAAS